MKSFWNDSYAKPYLNDPLRVRVYTSQLLGRELALVLQGGGNTSVKTSVKNLFGDNEEILYVKGSGWDLAIIREFTNLGQRFGHQSQCTPNGIKDLYPFFRKGSCPGIVNISHL